ncbi:MAG: HlyD family efflux transporter periplasmic adaptor subunit [Candidatus Kapaibacterium sp.]|jgi:multidrug efflux pump subunit AcrA (membrane-fusion protein)|nr:HlyD family efflux transporter periplasmic adaptor subunit [Candidatus Kapabacteria bacterium]
MNRKLIISLIGSIIIVGLSIVLFKAMSGKKANKASIRTIETTKYVKTIEVNYANNQFVLSGNGRLNAANSIEIYSEVQGIMKQESSGFKVGHYYSKGDSMINIDDEEARLQLASMKSDYLNILANAMPDIKNDFPDEFNKWSLFVQNIDINKPLPDFPKYDNGKEKFFIAAKKILGTYYNIKNSELKLSKYLIRAPFNGTVSNSLIESGTLVRPGQKLGELTGTDGFELEIAINPSDVELINTGSPVRIFNGDVETIGKIIRMSNQIDAATQTVKVFVRVSGQNLSDGMYLKVEITGNHIPNSMVIPRKAIVNNRYVFTYEEGRLGRQEIAILALGSETAYITGPAEGTKIISEQLTNPTIGMKLELIQN